MARSRFFGVKRAVALRHDLVEPAAGRVAGHIRGLADTWQLPRALLDFAEDLVDRQQRGPGRDGVILFFVAHGLVGYLA